ncbi:MAG: beta-glucosidase, partial [Chitinivibrionales bacterium]|nr:beta-glucosidase [Chitinivibrionales bacterium]
NTDEERRHSVGELNNLQRIAVEESRLGIPVILAKDVIHGHRTVFPIPLGQAAAWNPDAIEEAMAITAREAAADSIHWTFTPMIEVCRDPRWGRIAESYGEDPYLASRLTEAAVKGLQGDDLSRPDKIAACAKHYVGYSGAEGGRDYNTVGCGMRELHDVYLPPFEAAVKAGAATVMSSFNEIDGVPVTASRYLLTEVLKEQYGFEGFVISDADAVAELYTGHGVAATPADAAELAANAGLDMEMWSGLYVKHLAQLVEAGAVSVDMIDDSVRRILRVKFLCGLFENPYTDESLKAKVMLCDEHRTAARRVAADTITMVKNSGVLPLPKDDGIVLVTGPFARATGELFGCWTLNGVADDVVCVGHACKEVTGDTGHIWIDNAAGYGDLTPVLARRAKAKAIVACVGEGPWRSGEANSITTLDLPAGQEEMLRSLKDLDIPLVVVVFSGRPISIGRVAEYADAVLFAWHPGVEGGRAVADVLFGDANPGGRLPVSVPRSVGQVPVYYNHKPTGRPLPLYDNRVGRYNETLDSPLYPFGFGMDYTTYEYTNVTLSSSKIGMNGTLTVSVDVSNTGERAGSEVVQLYVRDMVGTVSRPVMELKGFRKIRLDAGEKQTVSFDLTARDLYYTRSDLSRGVEPGLFKLWVGPNCRDGIEGEFVLTE